MRFPSLLSSILLALSVSALPAPKAAPEFKGLVTLPLKRLEQRSTAHPLIAHQQNVNRSYRRYARMSGRREPSREELHENLRKRVLAVEGEEGLSKRYNRFSSIPKQTRDTENDRNLEKRYNRQGVPKSAKKGKTGSGTVLANAAAKQNKHVHSNQDAASGTTVVPNSVATANAPTAGNSLGLDIEGDDVGYLATVQIGTPAQDFSILMDSGSADFWVGSEQCQSEAGGGCGNHKFLGTQSSSSFVDTGSQFQVTYGTGQVAGDIVTDDVSIAGLALNNHTFGVALIESTDFSDDSTPFDGLMGLAQSTLSEQQTPTPIESLAKQGLVADAITSYKIPRLADNLNDGEITFGGLDATKFDSTTLVTVANVNQQGFWEGAMDAITVDGQDAGLQGRTAILDTGTTLIVAPPNDAAAVHKLIEGAQDAGQGSFIVPCTTNASVALSFGGTSFAIDPRDIAFQPVDPNDPTGDCISGISSGQIGGATEWLVGDVFLKNVYYSTDVNKNTVSLAKIV
ncbi:putative aspartic-type endopeptidase CTSD [Termitomyces sp. J132]|nr:hypothetical protein H2248_008327 [Termitomyces sp. 'cryptogamus']KNZ72185.1 putative aspartic-type endopeptidase CTSD [Termitomyces sp. J132]